MHKSLTQFALCVSALFLLATPLFYWLTKNFYAEDVIDIVEAVEKGQSVPTLDLERDIMAGVMIQFGLIAAIVGIAIVVMMQVISRRLWRPFDKTLKAIERFRLENGNIPKLDDGNICEFAQLNRSLIELMENSLNSYRIQKEFTENASHELQTPLAILRTKLELLMQNPNITEPQAQTIEELGHTVSRLSKLNHNLLLLAKMENKQFLMSETIDVVQLVNDLLSSLDAIIDNDRIRLNLGVGELMVKANRSLVESMVSNLVINAVRHNAHDGNINIHISPRRLTISNAAIGNALDSEHIFRRFYRPASQTKGNGLGLAIVKSVCTYHGWDVNYAFENHRHIFIVDF